MRRVATRRRPASRAVMLVACMFPCAVLIAQVDQQPSFEVASLRLNPSGTGPGPFGERIQVLPGGQFIATNVRIRELVRRAHGLAMHVPIEGPKLLDGRIDIWAKARDEYASASLFESALPLMLKALLVERLGLVAHVETRETSGYSLDVVSPGARLGPGIEQEDFACGSAEARAIRQRWEEQFVARLRPEHAGGDRAPAVEPFYLCSQGIVNGDWIGHAVSIASFAGALSRMSQQVVVDRTGLTGLYSFRLRFSPTDPFLRLNTGEAAPPPDVPDGRPLFVDALEQQLGLRLTRRRVPLEYLVIQRLEAPSPD